MTLRRKEQTMRKVQIQAHRGASAYAPENTIPAFKKAIECGADGIECDIHWTEDKQFVVCHDAKIDRTSNGTGEIEKMTVTDIKMYDFGIKFDPQFAGTAAPTLREMLDVVKDMNPVNIEIKSFRKDGQNDEALEDFYEILSGYKILGNTIVSSFDAQVLKRLKELHPDVYTCFLYNKKLGAAAFAQKIGCSAIHPYFKSLRKSTVESAHRRGLKVNCWTPNTENEIRKMIEIGCDGIITNDPILAISIAEE